MMSAQTKLSVDTAKEVQADASLKTKAEKERRLKEKNAANTKKFMDERKNNMLKQNKKREKQKKTHETELENISKSIQEVRKREQHVVLLKVQLSNSCFLSPAAVGGDVQSRRNKNEASRKTRSVRLEIRKKDNMYLG